jgi:predicted nucleic acid-binding protein
VIAYIDASVLLRIVLPQPERLAEWPQLETGIANRLVSVECHRTLDRYWLQGHFTEAELEAKRAEIDAIMERLTPVALDDVLLNRASQPLPVILGTLDAIHLASALAYRAAQPPDERPLLFATHDSQLARAARAMNFEVIGA